MQSNNDNAPFPIFNYRKKPRQAVVADPLSGAPGPSGDGGYHGQDLMPVGGFMGRGQPQRNPQRGGNQPSVRGAASFGSNRSMSHGQSYTNASRGAGSTQRGQSNYNNSFSGSNNRPANSSCSSKASFTSSSFRGGNSNFRENNSNRGGNPNTSSNVQNQPYQPNKTFSNNTAQRNIQYNQTNQSANRQERQGYRQCATSAGNSTSRGSFNGANQSFGRGSNLNHTNSFDNDSFDNNTNSFSDNNNNFSNNTNKSAFSSGNGYTGRAMNQHNATVSRNQAGARSNQGPYTRPGQRGGGAQPQRCQSSQGRGNNSQQGTWSGRRDPSQQLMDVASEFDNSFEEEETTTTPHQPAKQVPTPVRPMKAQLSEMEKGLIFLTMDAAGVKQWSKYKDNFQLMFEVYGQLDSAIARRSETCKEFLLKDEKQGSLNCVFFEIDRQLPKVTRGQWYRVVGTFDNSRQQFMCLSIRPVVSHESNVVRLCCQTSAQAMLQLTKNLPEP